MPCYNPTRVLMDGDHRIQWSKDYKNAQYFDGLTQVNIPCRSCIGCNLGEQRSWSVRCFHEALTHSQTWRDPKLKITTELPHSCVVTLTYDDPHLPSDGALRHDDFQRFMKRLRFRLDSDAETLGIPKKQRRPIKYFMSGEYGGKTQRPHFHAILFGYCPSDRYEILVNNKVHQCSYELDELWSQAPEGYPDAPKTRIGMATIDDFSFAGAAYVAGYVAKKILPDGKHLGPTKWEYDEDGLRRLVPIAPEYRKMSNRPGLGANWILQPQNLAEVYSKDEVRIGEWTFHPPKYYDKLLQEHRPDLVGDIILNRRDGMSKAAEDWTPDRCSAAELAALNDLQQRRDSL